MRQCHPDNLYSVTFKVIETVKRILRRGDLERFILQGVTQWIYCLLDNFIHCLHVNLLSLLSFRPVISTWLYG